ncbi:MAG: permease [Micrococcales bacterium]|nr:MAG: permease [Micrococcales bacterium]
MTTQAPAKTERSNLGLNTRDLINVGVFTAVYFVVMFGLGMLGLINPLVMFVGHALALIANGVVVSLFLARVPKFGAMTTLGVIIGLLMVVTGHYWGTLVFSGLVALVGDLIARSGNYRAPLLNSLGYAIYSLWYVAPLFPIFFDTAGYRKDLETSMSVDYANTFMELVTPTTIVVWGIIVLVLAFVGGLLGQRVLGRHFRRAGLAR